MLHVFKQAVSTMKPAYKHSVPAKLHMQWTCPSGIPGIVSQCLQPVHCAAGCLAESPRPEGYVISNTAFYVFIMNASRRLLCDRFYQVGTISQSAHLIATNCATCLLYSKVRALP